MHTNHVIREYGLSETDICVFEHALLCILQIQAYYKEFEILETEPGIDLRTIVEKMQPNVKNALICHLRIRYGRISDNFLKYSNFITSVKKAE